MESYSFKVSSSNFLTLLGTVENKKVDNKNEKMNKLRIPTTL